MSESLTERELYEETGFRNAQMLSSSGTVSLHIRTSQMHSVQFRSLRLKLVYYLTGLHLDANHKTHH